MEGTTLITSRTFDAPLEQVWNTWTEADEIKKWWGPKNFTAPTIKIDFRVGGSYLYCMHGQPGPDMPEQDFWSTGTFQEIAPMERIVATDHFADGEGNIVSASTLGLPGAWPEEMTVSTVFEAMGDVTKVTVTHVGHPEEMYEMARLSWEQTFDKFADALAI